MQLGQQLLPVSIDFDTSPLYIKQDKAYFLKGLETGNLIKGGEGQNSLEFKPPESNYLYCSIEMPAGINTVIGYYYYAEASEGYVIVHNNLGDHFIYRLRGIDGVCQKVYDFCPTQKGIYLNPKYYFSEGRIAIKSICRFLPDGTKEMYKEMILVNKKVENIRIVIEDSIATNSFTTDFFTPTDDCCGDNCRLIKIGVPTPMSQIKIVPILPSATEKLVQNKLLFQMFQFRYKDENAWGQVSEYGLVSDQYFNNLAGCSRDSQGQPHCVWLESKTPCPEIVKRTIAVRSCNLNTILGTDGNIFSEWKEVFTIDLYDQTDANLRWYEREYDKTNTDFEFFNDMKSIRIKFCNNKECKPIARTNIRSSNPAPHTSASVADIGKDLAFANNENSFDKFPKQDIDAIKIELVSSKTCEQKFARIKIYAVVHNFQGNQNNPIHTRGGLATFGGFGQDPAIGNTRFEEKVGQPEGPMNSKSGHGQTFPVGVKGFRARLAGTNYTAESVQYQWKSGVLEEVGVYDTDLDSMKDLVSDVNWGNGPFWVQQFDFGLVPLGTYFFEINGHSDTVNLEKTSTFYLETTTFAKYQNHWGITQNHQKRIFIDTTSGADFIGSTGNTPLAIIADLTNPQNLRSQGQRAVRGYVYEDFESKIPIEAAHVANSSNGQFDYTDHNGFYFLGLKHGTNYKTQILSYNKCQPFQLIGQTPEKTAEGTTLADPIYATRKLVNYDKDLCNRWIVKGSIRECGNGTNLAGGIEGVAVILQGSAVVYTNSKGEFNVVCHYGNPRGQEKLIFSIGACYVLDCNCGPISVVQNVVQPSCTNCIENSVSVGQFSLQTIVNKGFPHGSRIQFGMVGHDWLGRQTAIQTNEKLFMDFPSEAEQGNATYPQLQVTLPESFSAAICRQFKRITFWYSKNTNFEDWIEWAADKIDYVDSAGNINAQNPAKVKVWYRSLNQYNLSRGMNTNTTWNIADTEGNTRVGDIVEFIKTVEGKYLPPNTAGTVLHDADGDYFLVDYDDSLKGLADGVKFKLKRQYQCETKKTYYEYGYPINFCSGDCKPRDDAGKIITSFFINGFSSYMLPRQIPVVRDVVENIASDSGSKTNIFTNLILTPPVAKALKVNRKSWATVEKTTTTQFIEIKSYPFAFEHHSPSDTWGNHCNNGGRVSFENPYEGKKCDRTQILLSGALNQENDGAVNYLHYFSLSEESVLTEQGFGAISALLVRSDGQMLVLCEFTAFSLRIDDDRAVVDNDGYIRVPSNKRFSRPERNPSVNYGCQENDLNTIRFADSLITWLDSNKQAFIMSNFTESLDVSPGVQSWLYQSIKEVRANPAANYWHSGFDLRTKRIYLTKFNLNNREYVNNEIDQSITSNETIWYDYMAKQWGQMAHFTPEYFGNMCGDNKDTQFFTFKDGLAYAHHNVVNPSPVYLNYYGEQCFPVIGVVTNIGGAEVKCFLSTQVLCWEILFILERLETSMGQKSKVYEGQWEFGEGLSVAPYLCDTENTDGGNSDIQDQLFDGDTLYGKWLKALYIPNPDYKGEYFVLSAIMSYVFARDGSISTGK